MQSYLTRCSFLSGGGRRDERDLSGFDQLSSPRVNVLEPVSTRRQYYDSYEAAAAAAPPISTEYVSLFDEQVREGENISAQKFA